MKNVKSGSIIVFHDSLKAFTRLEYTLPRVLKFFSEKDFQFKIL
jgi:peptidoglycan-N-acetylglucosamine deacetylase